MRRSIFLIGLFFLLGIPVVHAAPAGISGLTEANARNMESLDAGIQAVHDTCPEIFTRMQRDMEACIKENNSCDETTCDATLSGSEGLALYGNCISQCIIQSVWACKDILDTSFTECGIEPVTFTCDAHEEQQQGACVCEQGYVEQDGHCIEASMVPPQPTCTEGEIVANGVCVKQCPLGFTVGPDGTCLEPQINFLNGPVDRALVLMTAVMLCAIIGLWAFIQYLFHKARNRKSRKTKHKK